MQRNKKCSTRRRQEPKGNRPDKGGNLKGNTTFLRSGKDQQNQTANYSTNQSRTGVWVSLRQMGKTIFWSVLSHFVFIFFCFEIKGVSLPMRKRPQWHLKLSRMLLCTFTTILESQQMFICELIILFPIFLQYFVPSFHTTARMIPIQGGCVEQP